MKMTDLIAKYSTFIMVAGIFLLGWFANSLTLNLGDINTESPLSNGLFVPKDVKSPSDHISRSQIHVYNDKIVLDIANARWAEFTNTNSMDPILDIEANSIEITPKTSREVNVGDIIAYQPDNFNGLVVHRVIEIGTDSEGWYSVAKGDNLSKADPDKIRFSQIKGVLVGIVY